MKFLVIQFDKAINTNVILNGAAVTVVNGPNTLEGIVVTHIDNLEPEPTPHTHAVGPAVP